MQKKKGISLIVLVITIIVMIILAAAIIISLDNAGIINKANQAVTETDLAQVRNLATLAWSEAYLNENLREADDIKAYIETKLTESKIDLNQYNLDVTTKGVDVTLKNGSQTPTGGDTDVSTLLEKWKANVTAIVDGVPIPKGFVTSPYDGEKTKDGGLVIYELKATETAIPEAETHQTSLTTRNQYVWVPVDDFSKFVRGAYVNTTYSNVLGTDYWEVVLNTTTNMPLSSQSSTYVTINTLAEVQAMYESVKEYGGFYIARYEAGIDTQRTWDNAEDEDGNIILESSVNSKMNKIPYTHIPWATSYSMNEEANGAVQVARSIYPNTADNTTGVISTLTYGVQWDATLYWWLDVEAKDINGNKIDVENSTAYGNYYDHQIKAGDLNDGSQYAPYDTNGDELLGSFQDSTATSAKDTNKGWLLSTGALKAAKINNIYDMAGNVREYTMEGKGTNYRITRGGFFTEEGLDGVCVSWRKTQTQTGMSYNIGFRASLYIKK